MKFPFDPHKCMALKDPGLLARVGILKYTTMALNDEVERCGKDPDTLISGTPYCAEHAVEVRRVTREGRNLVGVLAGYPARAKKEQ